MEKLKLAACGIDCTECASYRATMEQDLESAKFLVPWYKNMGWIGENEGAEAILMKNPLCKGCWDSTEDCFFKRGGGNCKIRECCVEKQINHCDECIDFPCDLYMKFANINDFYKSAKERLLSLKANT